MQWITRLHRIEHAGLPVYIEQEKPDWFVPSSRTDELLKAWQKYGNRTAALADFCRRGEEEAEKVGYDLRRLEHLLDQETVPPYQGRSHHLHLGPLKEIWFHLTDTCNLSCVHCLFSSSPRKKESIERERLPSYVVLYISAEGILKHSLKKPPFLGNIQVLIGGPSIQEDRRHQELF